MRIRRQERRTIGVGHVILKGRTAFILSLILSLTIVFGCPANVIVADEGWMTFEEVKAAAYCVIDGDTGEVILEHNADARRANASTTKIMTALTLINDENYDPDRMLKVSKLAITLGDPNSARIRGLKEGDEIRTLDAMAALLIASANDVARVIAQNYGGAYGAIDPSNLNDPKKSQDYFAKKMNEQARMLGLKNTHFTNPAGFDERDQSHYTTARDLAYITLEAMKKPQIAHIVGMRRYRLPTNEKHKDPLWASMSNSNVLVTYGADMFGSQYFVRYTGVKTGTTPQAGKCLVGSGVTQDGRLIICAALGITLPSAHASNSWLGRAIPVRALMEEAAKRLGCPVIEDRAHLLSPTVPTLTKAPSIVPSDHSDTPFPNHSEQSNASASPGVISTVPGTTATNGGSGVFASIKALPVVFQVLLVIGLLAVLSLFIWLFVRIAGRGRRRSRSAAARRQANDFIAGLQVFEPYDRDDERQQNDTRRRLSYDRNDERQQYDTRRRQSYDRDDERQQYDIRRRQSYERDDERQTYDPRRQSYDVQDRRKSNLDPYAGERRRLRPPDQPWHESQRESRSRQEPDNRSPGRDPFDYRNRRR
ncbi:MAG TPA: hypothetical protein GX734_02470 [Clostridiaceae bacterium]|nr:hypothetical protein [Clostridiaceae bacterium]